MIFVVEKIVTPPHFIAVGASSITIGPICQATNPTATYTCRIYNGGPDVKTKWLVDGTEVGG